MAAPATRNRLLAALPPAVLARIWPRLEPVELTAHDTVHPAGVPIEAVLFPETGWASMVAPMEDGDGTEVGIIGRDGMVGIPVLLGAEADDIEALIQQSGTALRMEAGAFRAALEEHRDFRTLLLRFALIHHAQVARSAACNARHQLEQRLARWMLMAHDLAEGDAFLMTHELLGMMLGVRRSGITVSAGLLQKAGMIRYGAGRMEITDRPGLESVACECYGILRRASESLFGPPAGARGPYRA